MSARSIGRYVLYDEIAAGGMGSVHLARMRGSAGFARTVAVKRLHPEYARDPSFMAMLVDEANLASRIRHPNVVATVDVASHEGELFLVLEYVHGEALSKLVVRAPVAPDVAAAVALGMLHGLHAAHEATDEQGAPLGIVHRDVSPQNVIVGVDGLARVADFGVAKAAARAQTTAEGQVKGKLAYMAPEQLEGHVVDRRADVFAAGIVLWEMLAGRRLGDADVPGAIVARILAGRFDPPSTHAPGVPRALDEVVLRAMARDPSRRFPTARAMADAVESAIGVATARHVGAWVEETARATLADRASRIARLERDGDDVPVEAASSRSPVVTSVTSVTGATSRGHTEVTEAPRAASVDETVTEPLTRPSSRARRGAWLALGAAALAAALVAVGARRANVAPRVAAAAVAAPSPSPSPSPPTAVVAPEPPKPEAEPPPAATTSARPPPVVRAPPRPAPRPAAKRCDPPYIVDARGIHVPKPECL